ncbi:MAG TPA: hypothetical protein VKA30_06670, partial [Actinomycetota bacterium]|nr:hypothetical protein [Actinomycetota bacterium]
MRRFSASGAAWASLWVLVAGTVVLAAAASVPRSPLTPALPAGGEPAGWLTRTGSALALDRAGPSLLTALSLTVIATMLVALAVLLVDAWRGRVSVVVVALAGAAVLALVVLAPVLLSRDVYSYAVYGDMAAAGSNPYVHAPAGFHGSAFARVLS